MQTLVLGIQVALVATGSVFAVRGLRTEWRGIRMPMRDPAKVLTFFRGFRTSIMGLAFMGIAAGWAFDQTWLLMLSVAIGIEETIESSIDIFAMTRGKDVRYGPAPMPRITGK